MAVQLQQVQVVCWGCVLHISVQFHVLSCLQLINGVLLVSSDHHLHRVSSLSMSIPLRPIFVWTSRLLLLQWKCLTFGGQFNFHSLFPFQIIILLCLSLSWIQRLVSARRARVWYRSRVLFGVEHVAYREYILCVYIYIWDDTNAESS